MFAAGCVIYYIATGQHPFGERVEREINILSGKHFLYNVVAVETVLQVYKNSINENTERRKQKLTEKNGSNGSNVNNAVSPPTPLVATSPPPPSTSISQEFSFGLSATITRSSHLPTPTATSLLYGPNQNWVFIHLITTLINTDPKLRSSAVEALAHPFFWDAQKFLQFFASLSDRMEILSRSDPSVVELEGDNFPNFELFPVKTIQAARLSGEDLVPFFCGQENIQWQTRACSPLRADLAVPIRRRYNFNSWRDLIRMVRNKVSFIHCLFIYLFRPAIIMICHRTFALRWGQCLTVSSRTSQSAIPPCVSVLIS
jgi:serine/threonine protein kinase